MGPDLQAVADEVDFSGVARFVSADDALTERAFGFRDRPGQRPNRVETRFGTASATKGLTALTIMSLVESGLLALDTPVRSVLGDRLSSVDGSVTIEHLVGHTSGIGDYIDEEAPGDIDDYMFDVSPHTLTSPFGYLDLINVHQQVSPPGERFAYNNSGYVILSMIIEELTGSYHDTVSSRVLDRCAMKHSGFFRSDDLPADVATGYLEDGRTNIFHLPVIGAGDGGIYMSAADVSHFWTGLMSGAIVSQATVERMTTVASRGHANGDYGLGFWLTSDGAVAWIEGMDAGVSFKSAYHLESGAHYAVLANTSSSAWPMARHLDELLVTP